MDGLLNNRSLETIIDFLRHNQSSNSVSLHFSQSSGQYITPSTAFVARGALKKWTFAARFNHTNKLLPELQVWRRLTKDSFVQIHGVSIEPNQTGYLNVYEVDFSNTPVEVRPGDVFGVYQPREDEARYSLAFLRYEDSPPTYVMQNQSNMSEVLSLLDSVAVMEVQPLVTATVIVGKNCVQNSY